METSEESISQIVEKIVFELISKSINVNLNNKLLTQKDLAERWQVTVRAIENWRKEGTITPVKGIPAIRFNPQYIESLEGTKLERFSPLERRKLERELEMMRLRTEKAENALQRVNSIIIEALFTK